MLGTQQGAVFSKCAVFGTTVGTQDAGGDPRLLGSRWKGRTVGGWRGAIGAGEARRERPDAPQTDRKADVADGVICAAQKRRGPLKSAGKQICVWGLAENATELAAEVSTGQAGDPRQIGYAQRLEVARVDEVPRAQQMTGRWIERHGAHYRIHPMRNAC